MDRRNMTYSYLDSVNESSIARQFARYAHELEYESIPDHVIHQAKRSVLDTFGCVIGAYGAPGRLACENLVRELGGNEEATVFGSGIQTSAPNAALANSFLVRFLDYNDTGGGAHNSDGIPSLLAIAEKENATGEELLSAIVCSYEIGGRFRESTSQVNHGPANQSKPWTLDVRGGVNMPPALGMIMGLTEEQIANAIGICASRNLPLGILDAHREENTNTKNLRFGSVAYDAMLSCILAKSGFTGPERVLEGEAGINDVLFDGEMDFTRLLDLDGWKIMDTKYKALATNHTSHGHLYATLEVVKSNDIDPSEIESVTISAPERDYHHVFNYAKKYPRNGETANHSGYYTTAYAIKERELGFELHDPDNFTDEVILELISKTEVTIDEDLGRYEGISEITTKDGDTFRAEGATPGEGEPNLTDDELEAKFVEMARTQMDDSQIREVVDTVWELEDVTDIRDLCELMVFE